MTDRTTQKALDEALAQCRNYGGTGLDEWLHVVVEAARADERAALAATGDAPLSAEEVEELRTLIVKREVGWGKPLRVVLVGEKVLTAYTALVGQLAAARAELEKLKAAGQEDKLVAEFCKAFAKRQGEY